MSSVVVEPTGKCGQLYFAFAETGLEPIQDAGVGLIASPTATPLPKDSDSLGAVSRSPVPQAPVPQAPVTEQSDRQRLDEKARSFRAARPIQQRKPSTGCSDTMPAQGCRLGKPVRIGAVMLDLLRSYGVTEQEIAEGLQKYATGEHLCLP